MSGRRGAAAAAAVLRAADLHRETSAPQVGERGPPARRSVAGYLQQLFLSGYGRRRSRRAGGGRLAGHVAPDAAVLWTPALRLGDRKSTRLKLQSLMRISYAVFCLKKKTKTSQSITTRQ